MTTIYRLPKVKTVTGLGRSTIYAMVAKGKFPAPVPLTDEGREVGWDSNAVDAWVAARGQIARSKRRVERLCLGEVSNNDVQHMFCAPVFASSPLFLLLIYEFFSLAKHLINKIHPSVWIALLCSISR
jgi:prophage regulatory protein